MEVGSPPPPQGHGGQSPAWRHPRRQVAKIRDDNATSLVTTKARPPFTGGRVALLRLHTHGEHHESANCSPGRQELQSFSVCRHLGNTGARSSRSPGLETGGVSQGRRQPCSFVLHFAPYFH